MEGSNRNQQLVKIDVVLQKKALITHLTHFTLNFERQGVIAIRHHKTFQFVLSSPIIVTKKKKNTMQFKTK